MANIITSCRILCSILMLLSPVFSARFYIMYLLCGLTDMIDGAVARKTNTASELGAKLDTAADLIFAVASMIKFLPVMNIPRWIWLWIILIAIIKIVNLISGFVCRKKFVAEHTVMNKITGLLLFLLPLTLNIIEIKYSSAIVCAVATFSAVQEGHFIRIGREIV